MSYSSTLHFVEISGLLVQSSPHPHLPNARPVLVLVSRCSRTFSANMALRLAFTGVRLSSQRCSSSILRRSLCNQVNQMEVADLSDAYCDILQYVEPVFKDYGGKLIFGGKIATIKCHEDNVLVRQALSEPGHGRVRKHFFES